MEKSEVESYIKAGKISVEVKNFARELIKPGMKLIDIAIAIDDKIAELGAEPAFPVNLSIDEIAAHFTPRMDSLEMAKGILKVDTGIAVNGYIADTAFTIDLTENQEHKEMIELNKKAQGNVMKKLEYGGKVSDVGDAVQDVVEEWNLKNDKKFAVIKSLSGHQIAQNIIHAGVTVSNYRNDNRTELREIAIAVEPFITTGDGDIFEGKGGGIFSIKSNDKPRDRDARTVVEYIKEKYKTRPFCQRFIERAFKLETATKEQKQAVRKIKYIFSTLEKQGIFYQYPELVEKTRSPVSQFENTFVFHDGKKIITTDDGKIEY